MTPPEPADFISIPLPRSVAVSLAQLPANQRTDPRVVTEALKNYYASHQNTSNVHTPATSRHPWHQPKLLPTDQP